MDWLVPQKPAELAEERLICAILDGHYPPHTSLPAERELAAMLGVTRPTLREALQRMARDGWVEIHQGKPTRVRDFWQEGSLAVLATIAQNPEHQPPDFVSNLLQVRILLAPTYTRMAVEKSPASLIAYLQAHVSLADDPGEFNRFDWGLHHRLTVLSQNPIFTLILNGFRGLYMQVGPLYFSLEEGRISSRRFYAELLQAARNGDAEAAARITDRVMRESEALWLNLQQSLIHTDR